jgi:hypothetical protein
MDGLGHYRKRTDMQGHAHGYCMPNLAFHIVPVRTKAGHPFY